MADMQGFKCPCCGGAIEFNSAAQKMKCPFCDSEFEMDALNDYNNEVKSEEKDQMDWNTDSIQEWQEGDTEGARIYVCESCGGEIVADENTASSSCPFCDNPIVFKGSLAGELKPDIIIPFKLDKKAAKEKYKEHLSGKKFLPSVFKNDNHIDEIKGVYVPFWIFDSKANAKMRYRATKVRHYSDRNYNYTETKFYAVMREGSLAFEHVPVDGSTKMPDDLMESLEPFDYKDAVSFNAGFFAGYVADKYDVDAKSSEPRANERVKNSTAEAFKGTVDGYTTVTTESANIQLTEGKVRYAMYPVWLLNTTWNGEKYVFAMNGQTGRFVGNLPVDKDAATKALIKTTAIATAIIFAAQLLLWFI